MTNRPSTQLVTPTLIAELVGCDVGEVVETLKQNDDIEPIAFV